MNRVPVARPTIVIGCSGWGYDDWRGGFYPKGCPAAEHEAKLRGVDDALATFLERIEPVRAAGKLGPVVAQLPPSFKAETDAAALREFVARFPTGYDLAVELRHKSWWREETYEALRARPRTALVWSVSQYGDVPDVRTTDAFGYARLIGDRELTKFDKIQRDKREELKAFARRIEGHLDGSFRIFIVANNHYMGFAPETARRVAEMLGGARPDLAAAARDRGQARLGFAEPDGEWAALLERVEAAEDAVDAALAPQPAIEGEPCPHCGEPAQNLGACNVCTETGCLPADEWTPGMADPCLTLCSRCARELHMSCGAEDEAGNLRCPTCAF